MIRVFLRLSLLLLGLSVLVSISMPEGGAQEDLLVVSRFTNDVIRFDGATGESLGTFARNGELENPTGVTFGPEGDFYVSSFVRDHVLRFDGVTGQFRSIFASGGRLDTPMGLVFGNDRHLYVSSAGSDQVLRFDGETGEFLDVFVAAIPTPIGLTFGPSGDLFVASVGAGVVRHFDGVSGAPKGTFARTFLRSPQDLEFGPDGHLYVVDAMRGTVYRFDGRTGEVIDAFTQGASLINPIGMAWGRDGHLYVANQMGHSVLRFDGVSGAFLSTFVAPRSGGLNGASFLLFDRGSSFRLDPPDPGVPGQLASVTVSGARPGARLRILASREVGSREVSGCSGLLLGLGGPIAVKGLGVADGGGLLTLRGLVPERLRGKSFILQALDRAGCAVSDSVTFTVP